VSQEPKSPLRRGLFIAFEGIDGAGKTTQALKLVDRLNARGLPAVYTKEPTNGPWGLKIRQIALSGRADVTPEEELDYFVKDRAEDVASTIGPALEEKRIAVVDRYFYSTLAYQSVLGLPESVIRRANAPFPIPDLVFLLDIDVDLSQTRITSGRGETANLGYEQRDFLKRVKAAFDALDDPNIVRLDGARPVEDVAQEIWVRTAGLIAGTSPGFEL
jgi:dTMP kinase